MRAKDTLALTPSMSEGTRAFVGRETRAGAAAAPAVRIPQSRARKARVPSREPARIAAILEGLDRLYPEANCELDYQDPFQLLVATILSAQCTDKRVNLVTPNLFALYPDAKTLAQAKPPELEEIIRSTGFFRAKAKNLRAMAGKIVHEHQAKVPRTMDALIGLSGVARKTANVVLGTAYGIADGVVVDTHVRRLAKRLGLTRSDDPKKIEQDLMRKIPREKWIALGHQLIWHGRRICYARKPRCADCAIAPQCPAAFRPA